LWTYHSIGEWEHKRRRVGRESNYQKTRPQETKNIGKKKFMIRPVL